MDEHILYLSDAEWDEMQRRLDEPARPCPKLARLLREPSPFIQRD